MKVLGHLAGKFADKKEDWATEALHHMLMSSDVAATALVEYVGQSGADLPDDMKFETQAVQEDASRPDLIGKAEDGSLPIIIESKFWAGLTGQQPNAYLERLPDNGDGVLVVVGPSKRMTNLWDELLHRCRETGFETSDHKVHSSDFRVLHVQPTRRLLLCSWTSMLEAIEMRLASSGEAQTVDDLQQLKALCDWMDTEAFLPLRSEELRQVTPGRMMQYLDLVEELRRRVASEGLADTKGTNNTPSKYEHRGYCVLGGFGAFLGVDLRAWEQLRDTPLWLGVKGRNRDGDWDNDLTETKELLRPLEHETPKRLLTLGKSSYLRIPLVPPTGVERDRVLESLVEQVGEVHALLTSTSPTT